MDKSKGLLYFGAFYYDVNYFKVVRKMLEIGTCVLYVRTNPYFSSQSGLCNLYLYIITGSTEKMGVANINDKNILQSFIVQTCWDHTIDSFPYFVVRSSTENSYQLTNRSLSSAP